jgi:hypothetical protein
MEKDISDLTNTINLINIHSTLHTTTADSFQMQMEHLQK